jgi:hypothetical protein
MPDHGLDPWLAHKMARAGPRDEIKPLRSAALAVGIFTQCECPSGAATVRTRRLEMRLAGKIMKNNVKLIAAACEFARHRPGL